MATSSNCHHRDTCRLCGSPSVEMILKLEPSAPVDAFVLKEQLAEKQEVFPMDLYLCRDCGHAQLLDVVNPRLLFGTYIYTTASSPGLVEHFRNYADSVHRKLGLREGALAIDIGSNDGTLLSFFKQKGLSVLGVDPAESIARDATARGIETIPDFLNTKTAPKVLAARGQADIVTANNVFSHSDTLGDMADAVRMLMKPEGVFVFEVSYLLDMVDNMVFDWIYHEHLCHHSIRPLARFLDAHGLHLFSVERIPTKGGSIRCFAQQRGAGRPEEPIVAELIRLEEASGLYELATYRNYTARIDSVKNRVREALDEIKREGGKIIGYGASATGTVLTYHFGLAPYLDAIVDDNPVRQNRYSPGHHIPIVGSDVLKDPAVSHVLVLAWRFADLIAERNQPFRNRGGRFVVPLPELRIL